MKKIIVLLAFALFSITVSAQQTKPAVKETTKKESCCANKNVASKTMTAEEIAKCQAKCKAEGKVCTVNEKSACKNDKKKCCSKKV
jgi:hypothetical protein